MKWNEKKKSGTEVSLAGQCADPDIFQSSSKFAPKM